MEQSIFSEQVRRLLGRPLSARGIDVLQVNLGYRCNMTCSHCHVSGGPSRRESMSRETLDQVLRVLLDHPIQALDITGGAPELHPHFRMLVSQARTADKRIMVRTNLTALLEQDSNGLPRYLADHGVELVASLPCYLEKNVDDVRGAGAFSKSIQALRMLNKLGYGSGSRARPLTLVANPLGAFLSPPQADLEEDYHRELKARYDVTFDRLFAVANMPVGRFREQLIRTDDLERYQDALASAFNSATLEQIMCRSLVNVGWDGRLYDCDFNQLLGLGVEGTMPAHIAAYDHALLSGRTILVGDHCFGCTAGQGSSCAGAVDIRQPGRRICSDRRLMGSEKSPHI